MAIEFDGKGNIVDTTSDGVIAVKLYSMQKQIDEKGKEIERLKEENNFLKLNNPQMNLEHFRVVKENKRKIDNLRQENKRLNNIINELEKSLKNLKGYYDQISFNTKAEFDDEEQVNRFWQEYGESKVVDYYFDKLQELKGAGSNE